ncbi:MAG: 50S ribosomal protein L3 N(5)-glutamine methyltransferase [Gammaproteobacteria bacterium]|nr:50S ribosomal protein L3 N(5)-glutamine methyltransferase [Gammaproteobacteria bacterium]
MPATAGTVGELLREAAAELEAAGVVCAHGTANWRDEAAAIVYHALGLDHAEVAAYARVLTADERQRCAALLARRIAERQPAPYLLGEAWFAGLPFHVDSRVLVPRSPVAELIAARFEPWVPPRARARILEIGTGSGCIAVACALAWPDARIVATDISADALAVARRNVVRHGVEDRVQLIRTDLYAGLAGSFDLIVTNPPYVPEGDLEDMPPEFAWEPRAALVGGADGLVLVRRIVGEARAHLAAGGWLAVEVGGGAAALEQAFPRVPFIWPEFEQGGDGIALVAAGDLPGDN